MQLKLSLFGGQRSNQIIFYYLTYHLSFFQNNEQLNAVSNFSKTLMIERFLHMCLCSVEKYSTLFSYIKANFHSASFAFPIFC